MVKQERIKYLPKKRLGQVYLTDENICRKIIDAFHIKREDVVLEIGPGQGALTKYLINKPEILIAVELDKNNCKILEERFPGLRIVNEDFLKANLNELSQEFSRNLRVIGNIPYYLTSEILFKLIDSRTVVSDALLMMQEEVARRLNAKPSTKDYGITSVFTQTFTKPSLLFKVSRNCFYPKPKVDSRMVKLVFNSNVENKINDTGFFRVFVRTAFGKRRKTLNNALKDMGIETKKLNIDFDFNSRAESLSVEEFIELGNYIRILVPKQKFGKRG